MGNPAEQRKAIDAAADSALTRLDAEVPGPRDLVDLAEGVPIFPTFVSAGATAQVSAPTAQQPIISHVFTNAGLMANVSSNGSRVTQLNIRARRSPAGRDLAGRSRRNGRRAQAGASGTLEVG